MLKEIYYPCAELGHIVRCYWTLTTPSNFAGAIRDFRFLPDGCPELVFQFGTPFRQQYGGVKGVGQSETTLIGMYSRHVDFHYTGPNQTLFVKFQPWALAWLMDDSAVQATDQLVTPFDFFQPSERHILESILEVGTPCAAIAIFEAWLLGRAATFQMDARVVHAVDLIRQTAGRIPIHCLGAKVNLGMRRLEQKFAEQVGVGLKYYARIMRIRQVAETIQREQEIKLTDLAYDHGFFDQAHFIREFRHFTDMNPRLYVRMLKGEASLSAWLAAGEQPSA